MKARLASLDVFRGATIAAMILVNDPGSWDAVYPPLLHASWHGWTIPLQRWIFLHVFAPLASPMNASLLYALAFVAVMYLAAWILYRRRWFIRV